MRTPNVAMYPIKMTKVKEGEIWNSYIRYKYEGPVLNNFGKCINSKFVTETYAISKEKALINIKHQFNKSYRLANTNKLTLPGILVEI